MSSERGLRLIKDAKDVYKLWAEIYSYKNMEVVFSHFAVHYDLDYTEPVSTGRWVRGMYLF